MSQSDCLKQIAGRARRVFLKKVIAINIIVIIKKHAFIWRVIGSSKTALQV